jgi:hypothetical protein
VGFWLIALVFVTGMAFSTVPTPLYPIYQGRDGFSTFTVTVVFAVYVVGVLASLMLAGQVSTSSAAAKCWRWRWRWRSSSSPRRCSWLNRRCRFCW